MIIPHRIHVWHICLYLCHTWILWVLPFIGYCLGLGNDYRPIGHWNGLLVVNQCHGMGWGKAISLHNLELQKKTKLSNRINLVFFSKLFPLFFFELHVSFCCAGWVFHPWVPNKGRVGCGASKSARWFTVLTCCGRVVLDVLFFKMVTTGVTHRLSSQDPKWLVCWWIYLSFIGLPIVFGGSNFMQMYGNFEGFPDFPIKNSAWSLGW